MLDLETHCILKTCDVLWLKKVYGTNLKGNPITVENLKDVNNNHPDLLDLETGRNNDPGGIEPKVVSFPDNEAKETGDDLILQLLVDP
jgi:hypothetical protein